MKPFINNENLELALREFKNKMGNIINEASSIFISVKAYGCIGDGIIDDTENFQHVIDSAISLGKYVYIDPGKYRITERLILSEPVSIYGGNHDTSIIIFDGEHHEESPYDDMWWEESNCAILIKANNCSLINFTIHGGINKDGASNSNGIIMHYSNPGENFYRSAERTVVQQVDVKYFKNGLFIYAGWNRYISCCHFVDNTEGGIKYYPLDLTTVGNWSSSGDVIIACQFIGNEYGYYARSNFESVVWNGVFEYNEHAIYTYGCKDVVFKNCWNEANLGNIIIHGSVRFEGGYNIQNDTVDHYLIDGEGIVNFEYETSNIITKERNVIFNQYNGIITKGVELGATIENLFINPSFKEASGGTGSIPSKSNWECYVDSLFTVDESVQYEGNNSMRMMVDGRNDNPAFNFNQTIAVQPKNGYNISVMARTPDRMELHNSEIIINVAYVVNGVVVDWMVSSHTMIGNNSWEEKIITVPEISAVSNIDAIRIYFGTANNGTVYFSNPIVSINDSAIRSNIILRKSITGNEINVFDYNGLKLGEIPYTPTSE